jgi:CHAT domain-containing protein
LRFERLPETRREGASVAGLLGVKPWPGNEILKGRLLDCRSPRILHLATHGFFLGDPQRDSGTRPASSGRPPELRWENPLLRCGLALTAANTRPGAALAEGTVSVEGLLTAREVSGLDLLNTELVTLSACETPAGAVPTGRGVVALQRCFVLAGAQTFLMSLWRVPDHQRQELLEDFYRRVLAGQSRVEALREAKLALKARHADPLYWGAFVCYGDPAALKNNRS